MCNDAIFQQISAHVNQLWTYEHIDGLAQERINSIANALELLQYCTEPTIYSDMPFLLHHIQELLLFGSGYWVHTSYYVNLSSLCPIIEARCLVENEDRRCSNYIWAINDFIAPKVRLIFDGI